MATSSQESLAKSNGMQLAYQEFGSRTAPALLLIMGLGSPMIAWEDPFCATLAAHGFRVIRFDNRDCGHSTSLDECGVPDVSHMLGLAAIGLPVKAPYVLSDMADDAAGLLDALGIESAHVAGASMGGMIAQEMALRHASRMLTLTSIMSTTGDPSLPPARPEALATILAPTPVDWPGYLARHHRIWNVLCGPHYPLDRDRDRGEMLARKAFDWGPNGPGTARQLAAVIGSGNRRPALAQIRTPTLVIHGSDDPLVPVECGIDTARAIPNAKLEILDGMGHSLPPPLWPTIIRSIAEHATRREVA